MKNFSLCFPLLFVCCTVALGVAPISELTVAPADNRLHLGDRTQEQRTTSVNWPGLVKAPESKVPLPHPPPRMKRALRIVLDAGHGGKDFGAPGLNHLVEKELTLRVTDLVRKALERYQRLNDFAIEVHMSREADVFVPLRDRVRIANEWPADLFVSIHANSSDYARARGFEVFFLNEGEPDAHSKRLASLENRGGLPAGVASILSDAEKTMHVNESSLFAEAVFQSMSLSVRPNGRGVHQAPFTVLHGTQMPAVLIETGYLTNRDDAKKFTNGPYLKRLSNAISSGIIEFASHLHKVI